MRGAGLQSLLDAVLSADAVQVFKTHPHVYDYALQQLGGARGSGFVPVLQCVGRLRRLRLRMRVVWCNRYGQRRERLPGTPDHEVRGHAELPALLGLPG